MPPAVPGTAVSPGTNNCSFTNNPAFTVMEELVLAVLAGSLTSLAVTVRAPAVWSAMLKAWLPPARTALAGRTALASDEVIPTVSVALVIKFQFASTALTVTVKAVPAVCAVGLPVLPVGLPGEAVSPGARIWSLVNAPARTWMDGVVEVWSDGWITSEAVRVALPAVLSVTLRLLVPVTSAALAGSAAFASLEVTATVSLVFTTFQLASTALTVTLNAAPAVWGDGVPVLPLAVPGAAVSPGASNCNFTNAPALTVIEGLVLAVLLPSSRSAAVRVWLPAVLKVAVKLFVPPTSAALAGRLAFTSDPVIPTVSLTLLTRFQLASTALTVTLKAVPDVCAVGAPVFPVGLPGAAVSPGASSCSFTNAAGLTEIAGLVLARIPAWVASEAVSVAFPAVLRVTLRLLLPPTNAVVAGNAALVSLEEIATVSFVPTRFQLASTALTVTLKAVPAVCAAGVPSLPAPVPGTAVSPGASNCNLANAPALTVIGGLVLTGLLPSLLSTAVIVHVPAVLFVRLRVLVPDTKAALAGKISFGSVVPMPTRSLTVLTTFQLASTALMVTL